MGAIPANSGVGGEKKRFPAEVPIPTIDPLLLGTMRITVLFILYVSTGSILEIVSAIGPLAIGLLFARVTTGSVKPVPATFVALLLFWISTSSTTPPIAAGPAARTTRPTGRSSPEETPTSVRRAVRRVTGEMSRRATTS